ncbi:peroxisomal biogenesis factor 3 [Anopheles maculipalpis]|uniref:peroxisomal biogenesis factor 3 n=1 Tax=Anopheles maculipalpis TaxID=1496333 RepID=UPI002159485B|nr:peroxisomal biogenesis factor 3 [Anopheles maculipalpis]
MLSSIKDFLHRHRRKFITTGVVIGGSVFLLKWLQYKLRELQEKQAKEIGEKLKRMQHYECTDRTCNQTTLGLVQVLSERVHQSLNTDDILLKLRNNPANKLELWEELRIVAFTRLVTLVYGASLLAVTLRVQINILGGYLYKATVDEGQQISAQQQQTISKQVQTAYLSLIQHFMRDGLKRLIDIIRKNVTVVMQRYSLKHQLTLADTETLLWSIEMALNSEKENPIDAIATYTLPNPDATLASVDGVFSQMFQETLDVLESVESTQVGLTNVSIGFSKIMDQLANYYVTSSGANKSAKSNLNVESITNINGIKISFAKLIPIVNGLVSSAPLPANNVNVTVGNGLVPSLPDDTDLMSSMIVHFLHSEKLRTLGANVYETFCQ